MFGLSSTKTIGYLVPSTLIVLLSLWKLNWFEKFPDLTLSIDLKYYYYIYKGNLEFLVVVLY